jgi:hypothetical protein
MDSGSLSAIARDSVVGLQNQCRIPELPARIRFHPSAEVLLRCCSAMAAFKLSKWYLDCVTDSGDTSIAYTGSVAWGLIRLHYSSVLESAGDRIAERHTLLEQEEPETLDSVISWNAKALRVEGLWRSQVAAVRETVFTCDEGTVEWDCIMPQARVSVGPRTGLGYAEHLTMTIPPWKLPIDTLRWGRFTGESNWAVWIDCQGEFARRIVYLNGNTISASTLADEEIKFENGAVLAMDRSLVLRNGPLGTTVLSKIPGLNRTFPARLLEVNECKWRSRAHLRLPNGKNVQGWAIHEKVCWPK